jgi:hypothetical protein
MKHLPNDKVSSLLFYSEESPSGLKWKRDVSRCVKAGDNAGYRKTDGYYAVKIDGKLYPCHRLVLQLNGVDVENKIVDHIDRNRSNNVISNLRVATIEQNNSNKTIRVRVEFVKAFKYYSVLKAAKG